ncbi:RNA-splicing factor [Allomyces arbusculus]|nr:RNA-splicing factor [Allomyces arbusculus]
MGGGDLNLKKSWHPQTMRNQERIWKEEQKALEEQRKLQQLQKELAEERAKQELVELQEKAGLVKRSNRIEWMYAVPAGAGGQLSSEKEDYLLGRKRADKALANAAKDASAATTPADTIALSNPNVGTQRDVMSKIREDPLLLIRQQEQRSLQQIMSNPLQVKKLKEGKDRKKEKKDKKDKKKKKHKSRSRSRSPRASSSRHDVSAQRDARFAAARAADLAEAEAAAAQLAITDSENAKLKQQLGIGGVPFGSGAGQSVADTIGRKKFYLDGRREGW